MWSSEEVPRSSASAADRYCGVSILRSVEQREYIWKYRFCNSEQNMKLKFEHPIYHMTVHRKRSESNKLKR